MGICGLGGGLGRGTPIGLSQTKADFPEQLGASSCPEEERPGLCRDWAPAGAVVLLGLPRSLEQEAVTTVPAIA